MAPSTTTIDDSILRGTGSDKRCQNGNNKHFKEQFHFFLTFFG
jgi:hypothetical protein